jgi:hypothetical protein
LVATATRFPPPAVVDFFAPAADEAGRIKERARKTAGGSDPDDRRLERIAEAYRKCLRDMKKPICSTEKMRIRRGMER